METSNIRKDDACHCHCPNSKIESAVGKDDVENVNETVASSRARSMNCANTGWPASPGLLKFRGKLSDMRGCALSLHSGEKVCRGCKDRWAPYLGKRSFKIPVLVVLFKLISPAFCCF